MFIFPTTTYRDFTQKLAKQARLKVGRTEIRKFSDGEIYMRVGERVAGENVYIIGTTAPPSDNFMELLLLINALKTARAKYVTAIIPYFGYGRADHTVKSGEALAAKLMADLLKCAGMDRVITVDLHSPRVEKFFKVPLTHVRMHELLAKAIAHTFSPHLYPLPTGVGRVRANVVVVAPDNGALPLATQVAKILHAKTGWIEKYRPRPNVARATRLHGNVRGKRIVLVDDMIDTAGTITQAIQILKKHGAASITLAATHGVFSGSAITRLQRAGIEHIIVTDTLPSLHTKSFSKLKIVSIIPALARAILTL